MKVRIISGCASFYTTSNAIKRGVGDNTLFNDAVRMCYDSMVKFNKRAVAKGETPACGQAGTWNGIDVQLTMVGNAGA